MTFDMVSGNWKNIINKNIILLWLKHLPNLILIFKHSQINFLKTGLSANITCTNCLQYLEIDDREKRPRRRSYGYMDACMFVCLLVCVCVVSQKGRI